MRVLAVDFGFKRIGLAMGETDHGIATARPNMTANGSLRADAEQISQLAKREMAERIVLGLPLDPDGTEGRMARICGQLAGHLEALGWTVSLIDERLSSKSAEVVLREEGLKASQRRKRVDGEAAVTIFEMFIHEQAPS